MRPGLDVYLDLDDRLGTALSTRSITLGRVCCRLQEYCDCNWMVYNGGTGKFLFSMRMTPPQIDDRPVASSYECSQDLGDCMAYCRRRLIAESSDFDDEPTKSLSEIDFFAKTEDFYYETCQDIMTLVANSTTPIDIQDPKKVQIDLYSEFSNGPNPTARDQDRGNLHLASFCCTQINNLPGLYYANRFCKI